MNTSARTDQGVALAAKSAAVAAATLCVRCFDPEKPRTAAFFDVSRKTNIGLKTTCRDCSAIRVPRGPNSRGRLVLHVCSKCRDPGKPRTIEFFGPDRGGALGLTSQCRACTRKNTGASEKKRRATDQYKAAQAKRIRLWNLKRKYNLTAEDYERLLVGQNGRCAICLTDSPGGPGGTFHVDHDHATGVVRGLLCSSCNAALGLLKDSTIAIARALSYLSKGTS